MNDELPAKPPRAFAHAVQSFASPLVQPTLPPNVRSPHCPVPPSAARFAHLFQSFAAPLARPPAPALPVLTVYPSVLPGPAQLSRAVQYFARPAISVGDFPGYGAAGAATFILSLEPGTKTIYSWGTDIFKSYSGREQRINTTGPGPRQRFEGSAFLLDGPGRDLRSALQRSASQGSTFLLALPHEELAVTADSIAQTLTVASTTACDWAIVTQRVVVIGVDGVATLAVIQAVTPTTIRLDVTPSAKAGARVLPLVQVLLDPQQGFSRYPVNVEFWSVRAMANTFGWVGQDRLGVGATIVTYATGAPIDVSTITDADLLIWDRSNAIEDTAAEAMISLAETVDLGALPFAAGGAPVPDWARSIKYSSADPADWQWCKAFLRQIRGRQVAFLLSTNHADLLYVSTPAARQLKVSSASVAGAGDYTSWWVSLAHRALAIGKSDGTIQYVTVVSAPVDNGDGTLTLALDAAVAGTVTRISMAELVRLDNGDSDDIPVTWDGGVFSVELLARTVQEGITVHGYPTTAAQMTAACRAGTWSAGWLCEDAATPLVAAFGGANLTETASGGSPAYQVPGPLGDKAVRVTVANTGFQASSTAFLDPSATMDICGAVVVRTLLPLSTTTTILSKTDFAGGPGFELTISATLVTFNTDHSTPGNVTATATVPGTILASGEWFAVLFALDRSAGAMRVAIRSLISGVASVGASQSIGSLGSVSNAAAPFRLARAGGLGNTLEVAALYMGVGVGSAAGLPANLGTALSRFVAYLGA